MVTVTLTSSHAGGNQLLLCSMNEDLARSTHVVVPSDTNRVDVCWMVDMHFISSPASRSHRIDVTDCIFTIFNHYYLFNKFVNKDSSLLSEYNGDNQVEAQPETRAPVTQWMRSSCVSHVDKSVAQIVFAVDGRMRVQPLHFHTIIITIIRMKIIIIMKIIDHNNNNNREGRLVSRAMQRM